VCATPTINGAPYSVAQGASINLSGSVNADASTPLQLSWTAGTLVGGTDLNGALTNATTTAPTFSAVGLSPGIYNLTFSTFNICGIASAATTITVTQNTPPPTINPIANQSVVFGSPAASPVTVQATTTSSPSPTFTWAQTSGPAVTGETQTPAGPTFTSTLRFTPSGPGTYVYSVSATNVGGTSNPVSVTIVVTPTVTTNIVITPAEYRIGKQRLVLTATTTDPAVTSMVLHPYKLDNGTTFDPTPLGASFTNTGGGVWTLTIVGAQPPACNNNPALYVTPCSQKPLLVTSTSPAGNGTSPQTALDRIRT